MILLLVVQALAADPETLTLAEAVTRAETSATAVRAGEVGVVAAQTQVTQARSGMLPTVQAQAGVQVWDSVAEFSLGGDTEGGEPPDCTGIPAPFDAMCESLGKPSVVRERVTWSATARVVQPLTGLVSGASQLRAAVDGAEAARASLEHTRAVARYDATDAWLSALEADAQLEIAEAQVVALEERERSVSASVDARLAVRNDLLQVQLALAQARQGVLAVEDLRDLTWRRLGLVVGGDGSPVRPSGAAPEPSVGDLPDEDTLVGAAWADRDDLSALRLQRGAAEASARATSWQRLPAISAIGSVTHQEGQSLGQPQNSGYVGLTADWTVWAWGRQAAAAKGARATADRAAIQLDGAEAGVRIDVASRRRGLLTARASWEVAQRAVEQAEENLTLFRMRYDSGAATTLELLDAESQLVRAQSGELAARYGVLRAEAALALAVGG